MAVVLIVDDEEQLRILAEIIIQELGHAALTAASAQEAVALIEARPDIGVLFTDIGLQPDGEGGLELARRVLARRPALPILYTTGQGVTEAMRAGFAEPFGFLPKPYTPAALKTALGNLLSGLAAPPPAEPVKSADRAGPGEGGWPGEAGPSVIVAPEERPSPRRG
jgi:DNA-binding NtrC family response regulator